MPYNLPVILHGLFCLWQQHSIGRKGLQFLLCSSQHKKDNLECSCGGHKRLSGVADQPSLESDSSAGDRGWVLLTFMHGIYHDVLHTGSAHLVCWVNNSLEVLQAAPMHDSVTLGPTFV